jgi:Protein of unknown function (DUF1674)
MSIGVPLEAIALQGQREHYAAMTKRATKRPKPFAKPAHWSDEPAPQPEPLKQDEDPDGLSPTRYGDWVRKGIAVDF